jgi:hypothetical protein
MEDGMSAPDHSPLPWDIAGTDVWDSKGDIVVYGSNIPENPDANARLIVSAVNTRAKLLAALKDLLRFNEELCADINVSKHYPSAEKARAAADEPAP